MVKGLIVPALLLMLAVACLSVMPGGQPATTDGAEFGFRFPKNDLDRKLREAAQLSEQIYFQSPVCRTEFSKLPDYPPGQPLVSWVTNWADGSKTRIARTTWTRHRPPKIEVLAYYLNTFSVEKMALVLIHEQAHVASVRTQVPFFGDKPKEEVVALMNENEATASKIMWRCAESAGIVL